MTVAELLGNEELRQSEFPVCRDRIFLAHAAVCPLPGRVARAIADYAVEATRDDQERPVLGSLVRETRDLAAGLIGAGPEEIALVGPTSLALSYVAAGLPWRRGDNVIAYFDDYPSNVYPWLALADRGVEVRLINARELGRIRPVDIIGLADENTRLVAVASCHFISGWRLDLPALSQALRARRIPLCLDGIQTLGAFPTAAEHADFIAADAHKWLLGPCGAGFLYVRQPMQELLRPVVHGWNNVRCPDFVAREEIKFRSGAHRYEAGSYSMVGLVGLRACLSLIREVGVEAIAAELLRKRALLVPGLRERGWEVLGADNPAVNQSGIVSATRSDVEVSAVHSRLAEAGVVTSLRTDRAGRRYLRFSPHFYNTDGELARALELL